MKFRSINTAKSRNKKSVLVASMIECLELRRLMSVSGTTLFGATDDGTVWNYEIDNGNTAQGTTVVTLLGAATFNGQQAGDRKAVTTSATSGNINTTHDYVRDTGSGIADYGSVSSTANSSGGIISSDMDVNTPADIVYPAQVTAGVTYTSTYSDTDTDTTPGDATTPTVTSNTETLVLTSETTQPVTVVAGTFQAYVLNFTSTTTQSDGTVGTPSTITEYISQGVGLVKIVGDSSSTFVEQLTSFNGVSNGGGGGGGGATVATGALTPLVLKTSFPSSVVAGGTTHGTATVNLGNTNITLVKEAVTTQVYASLDGAVDSNSVLLGTLTKSVSVKPGTAKPVTVSIASLPTSLSGTYTLLAKITDPSGTRSSTTGPTLVVAAPFTAFTSEAISTNLTGSIVSGSKTKDSVSISLTNTGNVQSTGTSSVSLLVSADATGTLTAIRTVAESISLKPGKSKTIKIPLQTLPNVADGTYHIVAQITDPKGNLTSVTTPTTVSLAQAFIQLTPSLSAIVRGVKGTGTVTLTVTNNGNVPPVGASQVTLYAATATTINGATQLSTQKASLPIKPGKSKTIKFKLTAAEVTSIADAGLLLVSVTDPMGGVLTATSTLPAA